jgi:hypothetical protein
MPPHAGQHHMGLHARTSGSSNVVSTTTEWHLTGLRARTMCSSQSAPPQHSGVHGDGESIALYQLGRSCIHKDWCTEHSVITAHKFDLQTRSSCGTISRACCGRWNWTARTWTSSARASSPATPSTSPASHRRAAPSEEAVLTYGCTSALVTNAVLIRGVYLCKA